MHKRKQSDSDLDFKSVPKQLLINILQSHSIAENGSQESKQELSGPVPNTECDIDCFTQGTKRSKSRKSELPLLPQEMLLHVFSFLNLPQLFNSMLVNREWYQTIRNDNQLWKRLTAKYYSLDRFRWSQVLLWHDCLKSWRTTSWVGNLLQGAVVRVVGVLVEGAAVLGFDMSIETDKDIQDSGSSIEPKTWVSGDVAWYPLSTTTSLSRKTDQDEHICGILDSSSLSFTGSTSDSQDYDVTQSYALSYHRDTASFFGRNSTENLDFPNFVFGNIVPDEFEISKQFFLSLYNTLRHHAVQQSEKDRLDMTTYCKGKLENLSNLLSNFGLASVNQVY